MSSDSIQRGSGRGRCALVVLGLLLVVCLLGIDRELWTPDEPREAEISREMLLTPSVVPTLNGEHFIEKPPLYYWSVAAVFALTGEPSAAGARSVSAIASWLTLLLVFLWGRRELSSRVGLVAAMGLATSVQFMVSSHWVLIDPLLMLFTTLAAWTGWELVQGRGGWLRGAQFYLALGLALWTKGLIGPVLLGAGLFVYALTARSPRPLWRVYPIAGVLLMAGATALLAALIYLDAGEAAVREWLWVNHVQRFIDPDYTGHEQPWYYYLYVLPTAVFPWWVPFAQSLRPSRWRVAARGGFEHYLGAMSLGMVLLLSASATKRGIYLLPLLPLLMLLLAARAVGWWDALETPLRKHWAWWLQCGCSFLLAVVPTVMALLYLRTADPIAVTFLVALCLLAIALGVLTSLDRRRLAAYALAAQAVAAVVGLLVVTAHLAAPQKDMRPFVAWLDTQVPAGEPIYALGALDETFYGIVPFVTGRSVESVTTEELAVARPAYVLVQDKEGGATAPELPPPYALLRERSFGPGRYFAIWRDPTAADGGAAGRP